MCQIGPRVRWHKLNLENIDKNEYTIYNITYWGKMERTDFYTKINKQILVSTNFTHYFYFNFFYTYLLYIRFIKFKI